MASSPPPTANLRPLSLAQRPLQLRSSSVADTSSQPPSPAQTPISPADASFQRHPKRYSTLSYAPTAAPPSSMPSPLQSPNPGLSRSSSRSGTRPTGTSRASVDVTVPGGVAPKRPSSFYGSSPVTPATGSGSEEVPSVFNEISQEPLTRRDSTDAASRADAAAAVMTLAETHADLLHSIAQKEAKCLELRTQLSQQEAELKELKSQWTNIVQKTLPASSLTGGSGGSISLAGAAVIREGVGRLFSNVTAPLASALDALDSTPEPASVRDTSEADARARRAGKIVRGHTPNSSSRSSASNSSFAASRYSISSTSSSSAAGRTDPQFDEGKMAASSPLSRTGPDYFAGTDATADTEGRSKNSTPTQRQSGDIVSPTTTWAAAIPGIDGLNKKWEEIQRGDTCVYALFTILAYHVLVGRPKQWSW